MIKHPKGVLICFPLKKVLIEEKDMPPFSMLPTAPKVRRRTSSSLIFITSIVSLDDAETNSEIFPYEKLRYFETIFKILSQKRRERKILFTMDYHKKQS